MLVDNFWNLKLVFLLFPPFLPLQKKKTFNMKSIFVLISIWPATLSFE